MKRMFLLALGTLLLVPAMARASQNDNMVKTAVASDSKNATSPVGNKAGRSAHYLIFDGAGELIEVIDNPYKDATSGAGASVADYLAEKGVTTVIGGNCGISPAPLRRETLGRLHDFASIARDEHFDYNWESFAEYLEQMGNARPALNLAELVGHSSLRYAGSNSARGRMPDEELSTCLDQLRRA